MSVAAWGQPETGRTATSPAAVGGAVTIAELEGATIEMTTVREQVVRRDVREFPVRVETDLKVVIGPGDGIHWTLATTSHGPRGLHKAEPKAFSGRLERPGETTFFGTGHGVWIFSDGTLTTLRTYKTGALKREIKFARTGEGLGCTATEGFAREDGTGSIVFNSPVDGLPVTIVSEKEVSSRCQVTKAR